MAISIQTNVNSLTAQENLRVTTEFQGQTIQRLTSGFRINASGDDAAGLAVANKYRSQIAELSQGVRNANDGISQLQIIDGGLNNISKMLDRMKTLATQSSSTTFTGDRATLDKEFKTLLSEIDRQATNVNLNNGGSFNTNMKVYLGGASSANSNAQVSIDLSTSAVDSSSLNLSGATVIGGGTGFASNTTRLDDTMAKFNVGAAGGANGESFTVNYLDNNGVAQRKTMQIDSKAAGYSGSEFVAAVNSKLEENGISGITAQIGGDGTLQFVGNRAFGVEHSNVGTLSAASISNGGTASLTNSGMYNVSGAFTAFTGDTTSTTTYRDQTIRVTTGGKDYDVTLTADSTDDNYAGTMGDALSAINRQLAGSGVSAIQDGSGNVSFQSSSSFTVSVNGFNDGTGTDNDDAGSLFTPTLGNVDVTAADPNTTSTGNALKAIDAISEAVTKLGQVQGRVGTGQNQLAYAIQLAQSQISNFSAAESRIRDTDVAAEAANLTKAQVLQQASMAAMAQANSAPQAVLSLLRG